MIQKASMIIVFIFLIRLLSSCDYLFAPYSSTEYEIYYNSVSTELINTVGFEPTIAKDSVFRKSFGLTVSVYFTLTEISELVIPSNIFGINSAVAENGPSKVYHYMDSIEHITITVTNMESNKEMKVTELFREYPFEENRMPGFNHDLFKELQRDGFDFELVDYDEIPTFAKFKVEVHLTSGLILRDETEQIKFYD